MTSEEARDLTERLDQAKRELHELSEAEQRDPEQRLGEELLAELNRSRTPWFTAGEIGGDDGAG
jgi:hypothetical protein